jgi:hypothetical protein
MNAVVICAEGLSKSCRRGALAVLFGGLFFFNHMEGTITDRV